MDAMHVLASWFQVREAGVDNPISIPARFLVNHDFN
jgi:hypothetical protein